MLSPTLPKQMTVLHGDRSGGIGAACARELAARGYSMALLARSEQVHDLARELGGFGHSCLNRFHILEPMPFRSSFRFDQ